MFPPYSGNNENGSPTEVDSKSNEESLFSIHKKIQLHLQGVTNLTKSDVRRLAMKLESFTCSSPDQLIILTTAQDILLKIFQNLSKNEETQVLASSPLKAPRKKLLVVKRSTLSPYNVPTHEVGNTAFSFVFSQGSESVAASQNNLNLTLPNSQNPCFSPPRNTYEQSEVNMKNPLIMESSESYQNQGFISFPQNEQLGSETNMNNPQAENSDLAQKQSFMLLPCTLSHLGFDESSNLKDKYLAVSNYEEISQKDYNALPLEDNVLNLQFNRVDNNNEEISFPTELLTNNNFQTPLSGVEEIEGQQSIKNSSNSTEIFETFGYSIPNSNKIISSLSSCDSIEINTEANTSTNNSVHLPASSDNTFVAASIINNDSYIVEEAIAIPSQLSPDFLHHENPLIRSNEGDKQTQENSLYPDSSWDKTTVNLNKSIEQRNNDGDASVDSDLTQIVENMVIDEELNYENDFQSHNTTSCTEMVEVTQNNSTSLIKFERQESNLSVIENTPQAKYPSYAKLLKSIPPQNHDAVSDMVIDETEYHTLSKHDSIEQLNKLCYDLNLGLSANETNKASDNLSKNNNNKIWCTSQSFSLLDIQSLRNVTNTVCSEVEAIKPITEEDTAMDKKTETENMILIDGALVQNDQSDENDTDESFAKKQELKADKIVEIRAKYTDMWNAMPLSERVSKRFVEKFQIRILEDPVDSLLDINYRPNLNSFYFPRVSQKELLCNLKESNDLSVQLSTILSTVSANMLQRDHIKNMKVAAVADKKISSQTSIEHFDMAVKKYEEGNEEDNQLDTSSTSSEDSPNHQWVKAYLNKAKTDIWKNLQNEELPIERLRWNEDLNEGETSEPDLTEDERFENMCRQIGTADWLNVKPDDL